MKHTAFVALTLAALPLLAGGCKKKEDGGGAGTGSASGSGSAPAKQLEPFTGTLTVDRVMGARDLVKPFDPWDEGFARLQAQVGAPSKVEGPRHTWAVVEGEACAYFYVTKDNGADYKMEGIIVGTVQSPSKATKAEGPIGNYNECLKAAGVQLGPPEDPDAAGPPADGSPVPLADVRANVIPGRSKWKDQQVKVAATLGGVTTSSSGDDKFVTVNLTAGPDDKDDPMSCSLEKNAPAPELKQGSAVIATGKVSIQEWTSMGSGEVTLKASLSDCSIAAADAAGK